MGSHASFVRANFAVGPFVYPPASCRRATLEHGSEPMNEIISQYFDGCPNWRPTYDGVDPFDDHDTLAAGTLACRVYPTADGSPTVDHLATRWPDTAGGWRRANVSAMDKRGTAVIAALLALLGCGASAPPDGPAIRADLAQATVDWSEAGIGNYRLAVSETRNSWARGCRWETEVSDGVVTEASVDPTSTSSYCSEVEWSVEHLHDMIGEWADEIDTFSDPVFGQHTLEVTFGELGVPTTLNFDLANGDDEESSLQVIMTTNP